ncbi:MULTISPECIES: MucB/RseB C-terminal domain-containing protein [Oceanimonas]|uniref:MucB/RseB C-terminal domain-containing protein n=1 Tax=Oceanimonas smirnovii TaxID=264574 RepID=A0ABW7P2S2_9GAMM|nr:MucB/RseB C-terminal domain-containing protein [Oceanimonas sp. CAM02]MDV2856738.1 MucB/RseB C-terminal domain-containing protein [Oceanimonas sp. CAM02]
MIRKLGATLTLLLVTIAPVRAATDADPEALLRTMQQAYQQLNFELTLIDSGIGPPEPKRLTRGHLDGQALTHLLHLNGRPREFVQRDAETSFFDYGPEGYTLKDSRLPGLFTRVQQLPLEQLLDQYEAVIAGRNRVLGRTANLVRLLPKTEHYYGYVLWLDQQTGLLLRLDTLDEDAALVAQSMGVALVLSDKPAPLLKELQTVKLPPAMPLAEGHAPEPKAASWQAGWLPEGFKIHRQNRHRLPLTEQPVEYLMASNGIVDVSVYVAESSQNEPRQQLVRQGATHLVSLVNPARMEVTVVGDVPAETARRIAESVAPRSVNNSTP